MLVRIVANVILKAKNNILRIAIKAVYNVMIMYMVTNLKKREKPIAKLVIKVQSNGRLIFLIISSLNSLWKDAMPK